jgi:hypothetical protein
MTMNIQHWPCCLLWVLLLLSSSCIDPYAPAIISAPNSFLVVDGHINSKGPTVFRLSRTQNLADKAPPPAVTNAQVYVEEQGGRRQQLPHSGQGAYTGQDLNIQADRQYRLFIQAAGREYASAFVPVKSSPPIDSVSWKLEKDGLQIYVSTHDPQQQTRYYRWDYQETFEFASAFYSALAYVNGEVIDRRENINRCWRSISSTDINIGTSVRLSQDQIREAPLLFTRLPSVKFNNRYSILVRQYAQTQEAYQYWETLKKNTENIGSLFDPLPTQLTGNITCLTDPREPVLGFVSAFSVAEKRLFITGAEMADQWRFVNEYGTCLTDTIPAEKIHEVFNGAPYLPIQSLLNLRGDIIAYTYSSSNCVDCRERGTNVKPSFWPN